MRRNHENGVTSSCLQCYTFTVWGKWGKTMRTVLPRAACSAMAALTRLSLGIRYCFSFCRPLLNDEPRTYSRTLAGLSCMDVRQACHSRSDACVIIGHDWSWSPSVHEQQACRMLAMQDMLTQMAIWVTCMGKPVGLCLCFA